MRSRFASQRIKGKDLLALEKADIREALSLPVGTQAHVIRKLSILRMLCRTQDVEKWTVHDVGKWLEGMELTDMQEAFAKNDISGECPNKLPKKKIEIGYWQFKAVAPGGVSISPPDNYI